MRLTVVIPARLASQRFPRKVLADLGGKSVLQRVWEQVAQMRHSVQTLIATDAEEVLSHAQTFGADALLTSPDCANGTARIASILDQIEGDFVLNVQGDEPFVNPKLLDALAECADASGADVVTAVRPITDTKELLNPNLVKVVRGSHGQALYFSRSPVPYCRDKPQEKWTTHHAYWAHIGVYGYRRELLASYAQLEPSPLETIEQLEQLRFLDHGYRIHTVETHHCAPGIDTPEDLEEARRRLPS